MIDYEIERERVYVTVNARFSEGVLVPMSIEWHDGRVFRVSRVIGKPARGHFRDDKMRLYRYTVQIFRSKKWLYLEVDRHFDPPKCRWFVEAGEPTKENSWNCTMVSKNASTEWLE